VIRGQVHDENAYALGGLAGHAGLFGTVDAVLDSAHGVLTGAALGAEATAEMARPVSATRALGWQVKHADWSGGQACSDGTLGHLGFTGTGMWVDRARDIAWTLLTNRVHPSRHRQSPIGELRRAVGEAVCA
jgi:CubicO group peptidase (beta-lactamase class C family)